MKAIQNCDEKIKFLLVTRQSKSKRLFMYNPKLMVESNNNLVGYKDRHKHYELFMKEGFILPKGGVKAGLKGQLVILNRKNLDTANDDDDDEIEEQNDDHENVNEESNESNEEVTENGQEVVDANDDDEDDEYEYY